jgi:hypothetical protein
MSDAEPLTGHFVSAQGDTAFFTQAEVAQALMFFVSGEEAVRIAAEWYAIDPEISGICFDENMVSALETLSPEVAARVEKLLAEPPDETKQRRARFETMLRTGKSDCC